MPPIFGRDLWYPFFADLGFLIMPCGFAWHNTTSWLFDRAEGEAEELLGDARFTVRHTGIHYFFYRIDRAMLTRALGAMRLTERLIRSKASRQGIDLDALQKKHYRVENTSFTAPGRGKEFLAPPNVRRFEHKPWLDGFSLFGYLTLLASITNAIDPMRHAEDGGESEYLMDFDTYGLCFLEIAPASPGLRTAEQGA